MSRRSLFVNALVDIITLTLAFLVMVWIKPASKRVYLPTYLIPFLVFAIIWISISVLAQKYASPERYKPKRVIIHILTTNLIISGIAALIIITFHLQLSSRLILLGTITITTIMELFYAFCDYYICNTKAGPDSSKVFESYQKIVGRQPDIPRSEVFTPDLTLEPAPDNIKEAIVEESGEEVFQFIYENINLNTPNYTILSTTTRFNVDKLPEKAYLKLVNLKRINDIRFINKFFESVNRKLLTGGIFIGCVETKDQRKKRILKKFPIIINRIYYFFDFIIKRIFPKFNVTKRIYFFLTRGENRVVSKAETYGRLYSCGFEIVNENEISGLLYYVARKTQDPYYDMEPTYGPFIKLNRIGKNGKIIHVYKLRTMHPYAEYLQKYIYELSDLQEGGKFKDDFRVTTLGKFLRKFWIDELPMLINFFRGDLKIVGVRPLSKHYFSLYSKELQEKRVKTKPGLIPPFYVDMPKTLDEIQESEHRYLDQYLKHPLRTDWKYFWKAVWNILFKKARSS